MNKIQQVARAQYNERSIVIPGETQQEWELRMARAAIVAMREIDDSEIIKHVMALEEILYAKKRGMIAAVRAGHAAMIDAILAESQP